MEQKVQDSDIFTQQAIDVGLGDLIKEDTPETTIDNQQPEEEDYDIDNDPLDLFTPEVSVTDADLEELYNYSPEDANRLFNLKKGSAILDTYLIHQQGLGGYNQIKSGNISQQVASNMRNNLPSNLRNVDKDILPTTFMNYWRNKLGNVRINASNEDIQAISQAAKEEGEDPDKWLRIAQIESNFKSNAISPSKKHLGYFQINKDYVINPQTLTNPYTAAKIAIRHNQNRFQGGKLDYQLGGLTSKGYSPTGNMPYSQLNSPFQKLDYPSTLPKSQGFNPSSLDPTGSSQLIGMIDDVGSKAVDGLQQGLDFYQDTKEIIGRGTDTAVTSISNILSERQNQKEYYNMIRKLYGTETYNEEPLDTLLKPKSAFI